MGALTLAILDTLVPSLLVLGGVVLIVAGLAEVARARLPLGPPQRVIATLLGIALLIVSIYLWLQLPTDQSRQAALGVATPAATATRPATTTPATASASAASPTTTGAAVSAGAPSASPTPAVTPTPAPPSPVAFVPDSVASQTITVAQEPFEHGWMLWRSDTKVIYVMRDRDRRFSAYLDTWDESQGNRMDETPPTGRYAPMRGLGKVWRLAPDVRGALGWALMPETGHEATLSGDGKVTTIKSDRTFRLVQDGTFTVSS